MNYEELADLVKGMPKIPRRELKCHPSVVVALRRAVPVDTVTVFGFATIGPDLRNIQVYEDDSLAWGEWFLKEDGLTVASGVIKPEPILNRLAEDADFFGYGGPACEPR